MSPSNLVRMAVPALAFRLEAVDTMIQHMSPFGRMVVLAAIRGHLTEAELIAATCLDPALVRRLLGELVRVALITLEPDGGDGTQIMPGPLGAEARSRMAEIDTFNAKGHTVLLERVSGQLLNGPLQLEDVPAEGTLVLPAESEVWDEGAEYTGPVPADLRALLPADGIGFRAVGVTKPHVIRQVYRNKLGRFLFGNAIQSTLGAPQVHAVPPPADRGRAETAPLAGTPQLGAMVATASMVGARLSNPLAQ